MPNDDCGRCRIAAPSGTLIVDDSIEAAEGIVSVLRNGGIESDIADIVNTGKGSLAGAINAATGDVLFEHELPGGGQATPMTYEANGRQFVVIMAGGHHFMETPIGDALVAFALPQAD